ncbi:MAG TPA: homocysteine S-methyltransferase family protein [Bacillota bacterium]|nr:homocysteine S-methyltransferase family protein [Bacillota bacterium]
MDFRNFIKNNPVVLFDGAMGTELAKRGLEMSGTNNLTHPDQVLEIQREYRRAGADVIITNTLTMNRIYLESHGVKIDLREVNLAGVRLARQAARMDGQDAKGAFVFGDISSTGQMLEPYGDYTEEQFYQNFKEQAAILAAGGVDGLIIETMIDLREAVCALKGCRDVADLPVIVSLSFSGITNGGRTVMGNSVAEVAKAMEENGADAVGANCGELDPQEMAQLTKMFKEAASLPVIIQPNAGKPKLIDNLTQFDMKPEEFAAGLIKCIENGASLVGGCCGTSPDHIRAIGRMIKQMGG